MENDNRDNKTANGTDLDGTFASLFSGIEKMSASKAVIGEPVHAGDALILPVVEISAGMAAGDFNRKGAGALNTRITPVALLVIQNGQTRLLSIGGDDSASKILDMIPDAISRLSDMKPVQEKKETTSDSLDTDKILHITKTVISEDSDSETVETDFSEAHEKEKEKKGIRLDMMCGLNRRRNRQ